MTQSWTVLPLGDIVRAVARPEVVLANKEYRLIGVRLDDRGPFLRETKLGSQISASTLYMVREGDFIYSRLFAWRGAFGVIGGDLDGCYVSSEFPTFSCTCHRIDAQFLRHWFRLPSTLAVVEADCTGSTPITRNRFNEQYFLKMTIALPSIDEQRRIVARIEELARRIEEAQALKQQISQELDSIVVSLHFHLAEGRTVRLERLLVLDERREEVKLGQSYPQVGIKSFGRGLFPKGTLQATETTYKTFNMLYDGALVLSQVKGWEGAIGVCPPSLAGRYVSPEYRTFRCISAELIPNYMQALIATRWFCAKLSPLTRGVGARRERIRPERFLQLEVPMPSADRQREAVWLLDKLGATSIIREKCATELATVLPSILHRAFVGEL